MNTNLNLAIIGLLVVMVTSPLLADDVTGATKIICSSVQATECLVGQECVSGAPFNWDIPHFMVIDLEKQTMKTTKASHLQRTTHIDNLQRNESGEIFLQGLQDNRAFSGVISEATGILSVGIALEGQVITIFGACTPMD